MKNSTAVLMADPQYFAIRGGANPHTRNADQSLKNVNIEEALRQWNRYIDQIQDCGIDVHIVDTKYELTGMVFAANAGFFDSRLSEKRTFFPSRFTAKHRQGESLVFSEFMQSFGFDIGEVPEGIFFEGEADAFPIDENHEHYVFTHGFRSDLRLEGWLKKFQNNVISFELQDPRFYHGDCLICSFGTGVLGWEPGLQKGGKEALEALTEVIWINDDDAAAFIGNSFYVKHNNESFLFSPQSIRESLVDEIEERGIRVLKVDINEFFSKGGGGPKCMVFNLDSPPPTTSSAILDFRERTRAQAWRDAKK